MKIIENIYNSKNSTITISIILFLWAAWVLFPLLGSGFIGDDAYNSLIKGLLISTGAPFWEHIFSETVGWATQTGRIFPFMLIYSYGLYAITQDLVFIKVLTLLVILLDLFLFFKIVKSLTKNEDFSYLCTFILPLFFQFRWFHDPILSFTFLVPLMCLLLFSSTLYLIAYLENGKRNSLVLATLIYLLGILTYELTYSFLFVYIGIILFNVERKRAIKFILYVGFLTLIHIASSKYLIHLRVADHGVSAYPGSSFNLDIMKVIEAFYIQLTATIPLSWKFAEAPFHQKFYKIGLENLIIYSLFATLFCKAILRFDYSMINRKNLYKCMAFSFFAFTAPALAIALSGHQQELLDSGFGYAYTPVFIQYFGLAVFTIMLLIFIKNKFHNYKKIVFLFIWILIFSIGTITREENILIVEKSNQFYKYPRDLLGKSFDSDLFADVTQKDLLIRFQRYPSDYYLFYNLKSGRKVNLCDINPTSNASSIKRFDMCVEEYQSEKELDGKIYGVSYFLGENYISGSVLLAEIDQFIFADEIPLQINFKNYKLYNYKEQNVTANSSKQEYDFLKFISYEATIDSDKYDFSKFKSEIVAIGYKDFQIKEGNKVNYWRWSSGDSYLILVNTSNNPKQVQISLDLVRPSSKKGPASIYVSYNNQLKEFLVVDRLTTTLSVLVEPGKEIVRFNSNSPHIENGDPRNIVFGIANYKLTYEN